MDKKRILELELMLGRTPNGRYIGESVLEKIDLLLKEPEVKNGFTRCKLCDLQMNSDAFASGCPNCGCKDIEDFEDRSLEPLEESEQPPPAQPEMPPAGMSPTDIPPAV